MSSFNDFWNAWPKNKRKVGRIQCQEKWNARDLDSISDTIIKHVEYSKQKNTDWHDGKIPMPATYINQSRWESGTSEDDLRPPSRYEGASNSPRPDQLVSDIIQYRKVTEFQRRSTWNWIMQGGVIIGVDIPFDEETGTAGFRVMHGEITVGEVVF